MKPVFALLADSAEQIEGSGGKLNIYGAGISHLVLPELPAVGPNISMVCNLLVEEGDFDRPHTFIPTSYRREDGHRLEGQPVEMDASYVERRPGAENQSVNIRVNFAGLLFERYGVYDLGIVVDGEEIVSLPLLVQPG